MNEVRDDIEVADVKATSAEMTLYKKTVGFLDLSAEIRNTIYELALTSTEKLHSVSTAYLDEDFRPLKVLWHMKLYHTREQASLSPNLLATCKTVHAEATPVLYGANHFLLDFNDAGWAQSIGKSVEHLRTVTCAQDHSAWQKLPKLLDGLKLATSLDRLIIDIDPGFTFHGVTQTTVESLFDFVLYNHKSCKDASKKSAFDFLELQGDPYEPGISHYFAGGVWHFPEPILRDWHKFNVDIKTLLEERLDS